MGEQRGDAMMCLELTLQVRVASGQPLGPLGTAGLGTSELPSLKAVDSDQKYGIGPDFYPKRLAWFGVSYAVWYPMVMNPDQFVAKSTRFLT